MCRSTLWWCVRCVSEDALVIGFFTSWLQQSVLLNEESVIWPKVSYVLFLNWQTPFRKLPYLRLTKLFWSTISHVDNIQTQSINQSKHEMKCSYLIFFIKGYAGLDIFLVLRFFFSKNDNKCNRLMSEWLRINEIRQGLKFPVQKNIYILCFTMRCC